MNLGYTEFWLVRHAPVAGGVGIIHAPDAPADLGALGEMQRLRRALPAGATAFCSPARRAIETAQALGLQAKVELELREQHFGRWTGRRHDDLANEDDASYDAFWRAPASNVPPGGESFADQVTRTAGTISRLGEGEIIIVAHAGTIRSFLAVALDIAPQRALSFVIDTLSLTRIDRVCGGWRVRTVNRRWGVGAGCQI